MIGLVALTGTGVLCGMIAARAIDTAEMTRPQIAQAPASTEARYEPGRDPDPSVATPDGGDRAAERTAGEQQHGRYRNGARVLAPFDPARQSRYADGGDTFDAMAETWDAAEHRAARNNFMPSLEELGNLPKSAPEP